jgi:hypothetical protein
VKVDWHSVRRPAIVFVLAIVFGGIILTIASGYHGQQYQHLADREKEFNQIKRRYDEANRNKQLYRQYLDIYLEYNRKGVIGTEQRLSWIEVLQQINKQLKLPTLKYEINPQAEADLPHLQLPQDIMIRTSKMNLSAGLLHEGDMLDLFRMLSVQANGFYALESCDLASRISASRIVRYQPGVAYINLDCVLNWYTVEIKT